MADESPGKVQALRAIFSEKNKPLMGMIPPNGKISSRPWKSVVESSDEPVSVRERIITEQKVSSQLITKVLPVPLKKLEFNSSNSEQHKDVNIISEKTNIKTIPKPVVGPKPSYLSQQTRTNSSLNISSEPSDSCDTQQSNERTISNSNDLQKSQDKSKAVAETIASFMFTNGFHNKTSDSDFSVGSNKTIVSTSLPDPRNSQIRSNLRDQTELINLCNSQNNEKLTKNESEIFCINSDNYICKSNSNFRRKELPSIDKLGPAPSKPLKPQHMVLPAKYCSARPSLGSFTSPASRQSVISLSSPPFILPHRPAPQRPSYPCPARPHTPPPLPPLSVSKPPLSLREEIEELYVDTVLGENKRPVSLIPEFTEEEEAEELYNDAEVPIRTSLSPMKPKEPPPPCPSEYLQPNVHGSCEELYQDAEDPDQDEFYEVMPCETLFSEEHGSPLYSNNKKEIEKLKREEEKRLRKEQKEKEKKEKELEKLRRKYGLTGEEIPIDDGLVKADSRGGKGDLPVKKGETVLILRMEGNPSGRWLVKNEKGKIGYVELTNIEVDPLSVKSAETASIDVCTTPVEKNITWLSKITACVR